LEVSPLCFGGNVFGWTADEPTSFRLLSSLLDHGGNFVDTADVYSKWVPGNSGGESERIIGRWFKQTGKRHQIVLATKLGMEMGPHKKGLSGDYVRSAVEQSLCRLQTDYIDLYQSHTDDRDTPQEETLRAFDELVKQGKVRAIGASNFSADRLSEAVETSKEKALVRYESLQPLFNLYDREQYERELEPVCQREGIGVIPYFSLAAGFLTGKYRSEADLAGKARAGTVKKYLNDRGNRILGALDEVSREYGCSPAIVSLAWLKTRPSVTAPIASATTVEQLKELVAATELNLDEAAIQRLNDASAYASASAG
jgi:aryl-alcohol dehydrogenase-like predicted oxidoreductase